MNIFRFFADLSHVVSILILLQKIRTSNAVAGISFKTQALYALVFVTRYLDLFYKFHSLYNSLMKVLFITTSIYTLHLMRNKLRAEKAASLDTFPVQYILAGSAVLAIVFPSEFRYTPTVILWTFSLWLESVAILPQLFMLQRTGTAENLTVHYIFALGLYRGFYVLNWIYRYWVEDWFSLVSFVTGLIQTAVYSDFFYIYYKNVMKGKKFELPQ
jgi:ER lumen protein retaining receptor